MFLEGRAECSTEDPSMHSSINPCMHSFIHTSIHPCTHAFTMHPCIHHAPCIEAWQQTCAETCLLVLLQVANDDFVALSVAALVTVAAVVVAAVALVVAVIALVVVVETREDLVVPL